MSSRTIIGAAVAVALFILAATYLSDTVRNAVSNWISLVVILIFLPVIVDLIRKRMNTGNDPK